MASPWFTQNDERRLNNIKNKLQRSIIGSRTYSSTLDTYLHWKILTKIYQIITDKSESIFGDISHLVSPSPYNEGSISIWRKYAPQSKTFLVISIRYPRTYWYIDCTLRSYCSVNNTSLNRRSEQQRFRKYPLFPNQTELHIVIWLPG